MQYDTFYIIDGDLDRIDFEQFTLGLDKENQRESKRRDSNNRRKNHLLKMALCILRWTFFSILWLLFFFSIAQTESRISSLTMKRILSEWKEIKQQNLSLDIPFQIQQSSHHHPTNSTHINTNIHADECGIRLSPMKRNLLEWHFSFTGMKGSDYEEGIYHGIILLHPDYPRKAPRIQMLTPSGRWAIEKDICLSASNFHQETWNPNWNLRTLILSLRGFMTTQAAEIGSILSDRATHRKYAQLSHSFFCPHCGLHHSLLYPSSSSSSVSATLSSSPSLASLHSSLHKFFKHNEDILIRTKTPASITSEKKSKSSSRQSSKKISPPSNAKQIDSSSQRRYEVNALKTTIKHLLVFSLSFMFMFFITQRGYSFHFPDNLS